MTTTTGFSADDLARLEALLADEALRDVALPADAMQGCFCALAIGPEPAAAEHAAACALGHEIDSGAPPSASELATLAARFYESTREAAAAGTLEPLLYAQRRGRLDYRTWCRGFLEGVSHSAVDWHAAADPDEVDELLDPLHLIADGADDDPRVRGAPAQWRRRLLESEAALPATLARIRDYWAIVRAPPATRRREGAKVGRNDPCPCGSGRKFKHCHGR